MRLAVKPGPGGSTGIRTCCDAASLGRV